MIHLSESELKEVKRILEFWLPDYEIWAFGSRVSGKNLKTSSDLDLAIISDKQVDKKDFIRLKDAFSLSDLPFRVDITDWSTTEDYFRDIIKENYEVIQVGNK